MVKLAVEALEEKKGEDVKIIDIEGVSVIADYFVLASASNVNQTQALVDNVEEKLFKAGYECHQKEGSMSSTWVLMDYGDVIVHVFSKEDRLFYDLERIWRDGKIVESVDELQEKCLIPVIFPSFLKYSLYIVNKSVKNEERVFRHTLNMRYETGKHVFRYILNKDDAESRFPSMC